MAYMNIIICFNIINKLISRLERLSLRVNDFVPNYNIRYMLYLVYITHS